MSQQLIKKVAHKCLGKEKAQRLAGKVLTSLGNRSKLNFERGRAPVKVRDKAALDIPQESIIEMNLDSYQSRDWRKHFSKQLQGTGLEIGPLHRPMLTHAGMNVKYIDRYSVSDLRKHYPELNSLPLVEPDILGDAQTLAGVESESFDFLISAHVIEHMQNPIAALEQWLRVLKPGGLLYLIVPDKRTIFDKTRPRTTLEHLILDYQEPSQKRDYEHYLEYASHVHNKEAEAAIEEADRLVKEDYSIHFHVFIPSDIINLLAWVKQNVSALEVLEGPCLAPGADEFHFMLRRT